MSGAGVAFEPKSKKNKEFLAFRCPPDLVAWLQERQKAGQGVTMTDALVWSVSAGKELFEATREVADDLESAAKEEGLTREAMLKRVIERGLKVHTSERKRR